MHNSSSVQALNFMISVQDALAILQEKTPKTVTQEVDLKQALGYVLAEDVYATLSLPPFAQSAMDGYALCLHEANTYAFKGEVKAGDNSTHTLLPGEAFRIFTGAKIPSGANCVVMQEYVERTNDTVCIPNHSINENDNIRPVGSHISAGEVAVAKHHILNPATVGLLASIGVSSVKVYAKPKISILISGNELTKAGEPLLEGKIYESNSWMLDAAIQKLGIQTYAISYCEDNLEEIKTQVDKLLEVSDVVLISGGISVGDYDFVYQALEDCGVSPLFYKIRQKPGKPLFAGKKENKMVFGLPGNPASSLVCFYLYCYPTLLQMMGYPVINLPQIKVRLTSEIKKGNPKLDQFLKAFVSGNEVSLLTGQESYKINSFSSANALIHLPPQENGCAAGDLVDVIMLPW